MSKFEDVILGRDPEPRVEEQNQMVEGRVKRVDAKGMYFTLKGWDNGKHEFGPAPYPRLVNLTTTVVDLHSHVVHPDDNQPQPGDRCLVVFVGGGVEDPWVIGWWPA